MTVPSSRVSVLYIVSSFDCPLQLGRVAGIQKRSAEAVGIYRVNTRTHSAFAFAYAYASVQWKKKIGNFARYVRADGQHMLGARISLSLRRYVP